MPANPTAGQFAKQSAYSGGYGSAGYDTMNQVTPEYNKTTAYQNSGQPSKGHSASNQSGTNTDIASSMYNKSHVTLNKVNVSIELKSFDLFAKICLDFSLMTNNRSTRALHRHSTWDRRQVRKHKLISSIYTFQQWRRIITSACISPFIR